MDPDLDDRLIDRIRWGNVARAAALLAAIALVVAWPRLEGDTPRLPDAAAVPVRITPPPVPVQPGEVVAGERRATGRPRRVAGRRRAAARLRRVAGQRPVVGRQRRVAGKPPQVALPPAAVPARQPFGAEFAP